MPRPIYLDHAAATQIDTAVLAAMQPFWQVDFYNPSATYLAARQTASQLADFRAKVAASLGARPSEIIFTAGGTEADNLAINGVMQQHPKARLLVSAVEHQAVLATAKNYQHKLIPVDGKGIIKPPKIDGQTVLVSVMYANNEVGSIQPLRQIATLVIKERQRRQKAGNQLPIYLHTDASQAANYLDLHVHRLGVDLMTLNAGKMYGPKQAGALYVRAGIELTPQLLGGGQERGLRSGTENLAAAAGLATALELAQAKRTTEVSHLQKLQKQFITELQQAVPRVVVTAATVNRLPNIVHLIIPGTDNERLVMELDEAGIMAAVGSACSASNDEPSHVLTAMGLTNAEAQTSIRFSMGRSTTTADVSTTVRTLAKLLA